MFDVSSDDVYESAFIPEKWPDLLQGLSDMAGATGGSLFLVNGAVLNWRASSGLEEAMAAYVHGNFIQRSGHKPRIFETGSHQFVSDQASFTEDERRQHPLYRDILFPRGLGHSARTSLALPTGDYIVVALERELKKGPVPESSFRMINAFRPHIARSALMSARLQLERARAATQVLGLLGLPGLMFDANLKAHGTNPLIENLEEISIKAFDRIELADPKANAMFKNAAQHLANNSKSTPLSFPVCNTEGRPAKVAHVIPVCGEAQDIFVRGIGILLLTPITSERLPSINLITSLFDFTQAEARVAQAIAKGQTLEEIAKNNEVSVNTVRAQLSKVFDKTGCHRQLDVASLFSGLAVVPSANPAN